MDLTPGLSELMLINKPRVSRTRRLRRQWEGDDIDLNAAVEVMVDQRMSLAPDPRLFMRPGNERRASTILVLLDLSESTNDCVAGTMRSILDIEKEAALMLGRSVLEIHDRIAIHGFSSNTREEVNYYRLLEFGAPLDFRAENMIRSAPGRYSTRMGAALRHATACIEQQSGDQLSILLVTDGAPADVDVSESGYLVEDARAAVLEAGRRSVAIHCIALDPNADGYVRRIFGWNKYQVADEPRLLPMQLSALYKRLASS